MTVLALMPVFRLVNFSYVPCVQKELGNVDLKTLLALGWSKDICPPQRGDSSLLAENDGFKLFQYTEARQHMLCHGDT